jgi:hypothetical protein
MSELDSSSELHNQIRRQVERTGGLISGEFEEASAAGIVKYSVTVHQAVNHLESLCSPISDEQFEDERPDDFDLGDELSRENIGEILQDAENRFQKITEMLYREGVL